MGSTITLGYLFKVGGYFIKCNNFYKIKKITALPFKVKRLPIFWVSTFDNTFKKNKPLTLQR